MIDHGGNLDIARERFSGLPEDWIDLSTGINRRPYPVGDLHPHHWTALPSRSELKALEEAAREAYATTAPVLAIAGAQAAIQLLPQLAPKGSAKILAPTYGEFGHVLRNAGRRVEAVGEFNALAGADLAI